MMHNAHVVAYISHNREAIAARLAFTTPTADAYYAIACEDDCWRAAYAIEVLRGYCMQHGKHLMLQWPKPDYHRGY
jgi:hypothetical protein